VNKIFSLLLIVCFALSLSIVMPGCGGSSGPTGVDAPDEAETEEFIEGEEAYEEAEAGMGEEM
jgi:hypothetical protein